VADNTVWSHWQVASRSSEVNFTKNYTLLYLFYLYTCSGGGIIWPRAVFTLQSSPTLGLGFLILYFSSNTGQEKHNDYCYFVCVTWLYVLTIIKRIRLFVQCNSRPKSLHNGWKSISWPGASIPRKSSEGNFHFSFSPRLPPLPFLPRPFAFPVPYR